MTVLDLMSIGTYEHNEPGQATDRGYWETKGSEKSVEWPTTSWSWSTSCSPDTS